MDLEVTESMDLSPGDHQHLVQNAADDDTQTPSGQAYATPPAAGPRQTHGNPNTKVNQRTDTYAVQISDEGSPDNSNTVTGLLAEVSVRRAFIIKVFLILSAQLVVTGAIISMFLFWKALKVWVLKNPWFTYALLPAFFVVLFVLACCRNLRRQVPANCILRELFTILGGLLLGTITVFYNTEEALRAMAATALCDFMLLNGVLFILVFVLITYGILTLHMIILVASIVCWTGNCAAHFTCSLTKSMYLVMDVQLMVGGHHHHSDLDPDEHVFAALNIYLDIINLFLFILQLIGLAR